jgi:hypothetical protein
VEYLGANSQPESIYAGSNGEKRSKSKEIWYDKTCGEANMGDNTCQQDMAEFIILLMIRTVVRQ